MAIRRLLQEASFGPDDEARMIDAYDAALKLMQLVDRDDPMTEMIAVKIIEVFRSGQSDPPHICSRALKELVVDLPSYLCPTRRKAATICGFRELHPVLGDLQPTFLVEDADGSLSLLAGMLGEFPIWSAGSAILFLPSN